MEGSAMQNIPVWAEDVFARIRQSGHPEFPDFETRVKARWNEINSDVLPDLAYVEINLKSELLQSQLLNGFHFRGNKVSEARSQLGQLIDLNKDIARQAKKLASLLRRKQSIINQGLVYDGGWEDPNLFGLVRSAAREEDLAFRPYSGRYRGFFRLLGGHFDDARMFKTSNGAGSAFSNLIFCIESSFRHLPALEDVLETLARVLGYPVREEVLREKREEEKEAAEWSEKYKTQMEKVWGALPAKEKRKWKTLKKGAERKGEAIYEEEIITWAALPEDRKRIWEAFTEHEREIWSQFHEGAKREWFTLPEDKRRKWLTESAAFDAEWDARRKGTASYLARSERIIGHRRNHIALAGRQASRSDYIRIVLESLTVWDVENAGREGTYFNLSNRAVATLAEVLFGLPSGSVTEENVRKIRPPFEPPSHPW